MLLLNGGYHQDKGQPCQENDGQHQAVGGYFLNKAPIEDMDSRADKEQEQQCDQHQSGCNQTVKSCGPSEFIHNRFVGILVPSDEPNIGQKEEQSQSIEGHLALHHWVLDCYPIVRQSDGISPEQAIPDLMLDSFSDLAVG